MTHPLLLFFLAVLTPALLLYSLLAEGGGGGWASVESGGKGSLGPWGCCFTISSNDLALCAPLTASLFTYLLGLTGDLDALPHWQLFSALRAGFIPGIVLVSCGAVLHMIARRGVLGEGGQRACCSLPAAFTPWISYCSKVCLGLGLLLCTLLIICWGYGQEVFLPHLPFNLKTIPSISYYLAVAGILCGLALLLILTCIPTERGRPDIVAPPIPEARILSPSVNRNAIFENAVVVVPILRPSSQHHHPQLQGTTAPPTPHQTGQEEVTPSFQPHQYQSNQHEIARAKGDTC